MAVHPPRLHRSALKSKQSAKLDHDWTVGLLVSAPRLKPRGSPSHVGWDGMRSRSQHLYFCPTYECSVTRPSSSCTPLVTSWTLHKLKVILTLAHLTQQTSHSNLGGRGCGGVGVGGGSSAGRESRLTEKPGSTMTRVRVPGAARDFSPSQLPASADSLSVSVQSDQWAIACINVCAQEEEEEEKTNPPPQKNKTKNNKPPNTGNIWKQEHVHTLIRMDRAALAAAVPYPDKGQRSTKTGFFQQYASDGKAHSLRSWRSFKTIRRKRKQTKKEENNHDTECLFRHCGCHRERQVPQPFEVLAGFLDEELSPIHAVLIVTRVLFTLAVCWWPGLAAERAPACNTNNIVIVCVHTHTHTHTHT